MNRSLIGSLLPLIGVMVGVNVFANAWVAASLMVLGMLPIMIRSTVRLQDLAAGFRASWAWPLILCGVAGGAAMYLLWSPMGLDGTVLGGALLLGLDARGLVVFFLYLGLIHAPVEELYWRGAMGSPENRVIDSDLGFAAYHGIVLLRFLDWPWVALCLVILVGVAWLWRLAVRRCGGLAVPWVSHAVADLSLGAAVWLRTGL